MNDSSEKRDNRECAQTFLGGAPVDNDAAQLRAYGIASIPAKEEIKAGICVTTEGFAAPTYSYDEEASKRMEEMSFKAEMERKLEEVRIENARKMHQDSFGIIEGVDEPACKSCGRRLRNELDEGPKCAGCMLGDARKFGPGGAPIDNDGPQLDALSSLNEGEEKFERIRDACAGDVETLLKFTIREKMKARAQSAVKPFPPMTEMRFGPTRDMTIREKMEARAREELELGRVDTTLPYSAPARKDDEGKPRWSLLPWRALKKVVDVLEYGAGKYAANKWKEVESAEDRYKEALLRHVAAFASGELVDPESGKPHLACIACNALFLLHFSE